MVHGHIGKASAVVLLLSLAAPHVGRSARAAALPPQSQVAERLTGLAVPFVQNTGQTDAAVASYASTFSGTVYVTRHRADDRRP